MPGSNGSGGGRRAAPVGVWSGLKVSQKERECRVRRNTSDPNQEGSESCASFLRPLRYGVLAVPVRVKWQLFDHPPFYKLQALQHSRWHVQNLLEGFLSMNGCRYSHAALSLPCPDALAVSFNQLPLLEYLVRFSLQFLARCFSTRMRLHVWIKPIELLYAEFAGGFGFYGGAEFLKMHTDAVQCEAGFAIRTYDSTHRAPRFISRLTYSRLTSPCFISVKVARCLSAIRRATKQDALFRLHHYTWALPGFASLY